MTVGDTYKFRKWVQVIFVLVMIVFAIYFLTPLYVMIVNSIKSLAEIREGNMLVPPREASFQYWIKAWSEASIGVQATGLRPYFINSIVMVVPAVAISTLLGSLGGFVLSKWQIRGARSLLGFILFGAFIR